MALFDIEKIVVGPKTLTYSVRFLDDAPRMTSDDLEGTARIARILPNLPHHVCVNPQGDTFMNIMGNTEVAHLMEHITIELLALTKRCPEIYGRTQLSPASAEKNLWETTLTCDDDTLTMAAISSMHWLCEWAFNHESQSVPNIEATVIGLCDLIDSIDRVPHTGIGPRP